MASSAIWPLFLVALGATTALLWWRTKSQHGPSTPGGPPSTRHLHLAVVPVRNSKRNGVQTTRDHRGGARDGTK
jgi:hypothetical protein